MSREIVFIKMQGTGNDFVLVDSRAQNLDDVDLVDLSIRICDRHFGVGADGLLLVLPSKKADLQMRMFNPDGSEAEMCGNGIRCFAKYVYDLSKDKKDVFSVETLAGTIVPAVIIKNGIAVGAEVDMGIPRLKAGEIPMTNEQDQNKEVINYKLKVGSDSFTVTAVSMGNPHCVIFVDDLAGIRPDEIGPRIENHPQFPKRTNVEFVRVVGQKEITVKVWERGAGETLACGTGACAALVAGALAGKTSRRAIVHLPGGDVDVEWEEDGHVVLRGPAVTVFEGKFQI